MNQILTNLKALILLCLLSFTTQAQVSISGIVNTYTAVTAISQPICGTCDPTCTHTITVANPSSFAIGDKALIIQMKGATINTANNESAGNITAINNAGNYEFFEIGSIVGGVLTPRYPLIRNYTVSGKVQVVRIPNYTTANITAPLLTQEWDEASGTGGVIALQATKVILNADINVFGNGFQGIQMDIDGDPDNCDLVPNTQCNLPSTDISVYTKGDGIVLDDPNFNRGRAPRANGGGSGTSGDSGGGGGSNYGAGGIGGKRWCDDGPGGAPAGGIGGFSLVPFLAQDKVFMGGAGGPGWVSTNNPSTAANGGGIVIIFADTIIGNGFSINAYGLSPTAVNPVGDPDGGGGGGAGGTVVLKTKTYVGNLAVNVNGGDGQDLKTNVYHGPGGGGGGGVLLYSLAVLPSTLTLNATSGEGGEHSDANRNGTTDGAIGGSISLYVPIQNPNYESNIDFDNVLSRCDIDSDNDGIPDINELYWRDHDNDGIPDYADPDFCIDVFGAALCANGLPHPFDDHDNDGRLNYQDADFPYCGGLTNGQVCKNWDIDGDGIINSLDLDSDNDGIPDLVEAGGVDIDGDGQVDDNTDIDGDGLMDMYDNDVTDGPLGTNPCTGTPECLALRSTSKLFDTNGDGSPDRTADADGDGIPNMYDLDSDNDGIPDLVEAGGVDINGDGYVDSYNPATGALSGDRDGDGWVDIYDGSIPVCVLTTTSVLHSGGAVSQTNTAVTNPNNAIGTSPTAAVFAELFDNNDVLNLEISAGDTLGSSIQLFLSNGTNNLASTTVSFSLTAAGPFTNPTVITTAANAAFGVVSIPVPILARFIRIRRNDGRDLRVHGMTYSYEKNTNINDCIVYSGNPLIITGPDTNGDGFPNSYITGDNDRDNIPNFLDLDSDNDGIPDLIEALGTDTNGDGRVDNYTDTDGDGFHDLVDGDVNNDGIAENIANVLVLTGADTDGNGRPNSYPMANNDGDAVPNFWDLDSDNDGIADVTESGGADENGDGLLDNYIDADKDGFHDLVDGDADNDGIAENSANALILTGADTNGDGRPNSYPQSIANMDGTGYPNFLDLDSDGDGIVDLIEAGQADVDNNGMIDNYTDTDNDGWSQNVDGDTNNDGTVDNLAGVLILTGPDTNNDGKADSYPNQNADSHGYPNFLDIDSDNDGIVDNTEAQSTIGYIAPSGIDADKDGIDDAYDTFVGFGGAGLLPVNTDGTDNPDYLDLDSDNDGIPDAIEGHDTDGDGIPDAGSFANTGFGGLLDIDNDGLLDGYDNNTTSTIATNSGLGPNSHPDVFNTKTIERDWREANTTYATNDINTTPAGITVQGNVLTNDYDLEGNTQLVNALVIDTNGDGIPDATVALGVPTTIAGINANGSPATTAGILTQEANGTYTFVPAIDFIGEITYSYRVCDNASPATCATATVTIDVEPAPGTENSILAPAPDWNVTHEGLPVSGQVLTNDNDADGDLLTVTGLIDIDTDGDGIVDATAPLSTPTLIAGVDLKGNPFSDAGTIIQNPNGTYTFSPVPGFLGVVTYSYTVCDNGIPMYCKKTWVTIRVLPALYNSTNAIDDEEFLDQGATLTANVLDNDFDVEGHLQSGGVSLVSTTTNGSLTLNSNGTYTYTPTDLNFSGNDEFVYSVCDNGSPVECDLATVYLTILPVNRDFGDGPAVYGIASHRAIKDANNDNILDGTSDLWLGVGASFETTSKLVDTDDFDDAIVLNSSVPGGFPRTVIPATTYAVDLTLNSTNATTAHYGMWVDWDNDGVYEDFYSGSSAIPGGPTTAVINVNSPLAVTTTLVNIRLRVHSQALVFSDFQGQKTNGEVEDYQFLMNDPLPVEMLYFNAKLQNKNTAKLDWATATELNNEGYDVEHALPTTGVPEFNKIGFVTGFGTTLNTQYYNYDVPNLIAGVHYFRLRQVDFDGTFAYTETKALEVQGGLVKNVFPTILTESSNTVYIQIGVEADYKIEVLTALGQVLQSYTAKITASNYHEVYFDSNQYASGLYFIRVSSEDASFTTKIRVQ